MIDFIKVSIVNKYYIIDVKKGLIKTSKMEKEISSDAIDYFLRIIRNWNNSYYSNKTIDREKFRIVITYNGEDEIIEGRGIYPPNYYELKKFLVMYDD